MRLMLALTAAAAVLLPSGWAAQDSLSDDARVAVVTDRQGTVTVRPVGRERWTPIGPRSILLPGDQVRTSVRGANAAELQLTGGGGLVLGPGTLIEISERGQVRLYRGEIELQGDVQVQAPGGFSQQIEETLILRSNGRSTEVLKAAPRWLTGYRSSTTDEWMGSLIAQVDGRDVPLSVGYHKVTVDIHDQIARTTVEQSFVNSTDGTLEGVFYFPLPAGASISGFGMWIGSELVEADIVEKQRARAIYEDILRRRKDPGLLEWSGGNLFKARVFPIFPHSEKRIQIRYTQVLPMEGSTMRYRYGLRSELLRSRPLRELELKVRVSSAETIRKVSSPSHPVRLRHTDHVASAEFEAEEFTPERDFELAVELDRTASLTAVPHRRGDDGYFMLLISPDGSQAEWQRELVPENGPLDVLLIADTSASMDPAAREAQRAFLGAFLSLLGAKDHFRLMTCDVERRWFLRDRAPVTEERVQAAMEFLDRRPSLGWTDLEPTFSEPRVTADTAVIYVGDGIGTTGDADPVALAQRLRRLKSDATFHAVYTSSTYEKVVLEALASLGGGSVRGVGDDPARTAYRLLAELAQPVVKDLEVRFEGLRIARVYPEQLPNLAAGTQQVVLGRFLPTGATQSGRVVVTGSLNGKPVRYTAALEIEQGEVGNSFIPRLWARRHIDALLEEGNSPAIQEEIVSFSEEFGIMTPYTSFLVLENDADRERYGVQRRVKMRDGERFFAAGRDHATAELMTQQMEVARTWRLNLRRRMLREIATLGKHLHQVAWGWGSGRKADGLFSNYAQTAGAMPVDNLGAMRDQVRGDALSRELMDEDEELNEDREGKELSADPDSSLAMDMVTEIQAAAPVVMAEERMMSKSGALGMAPSRLEADSYWPRSGNRDFRANAYLGGGRRYAPGFGNYRFPPLPAPPALSAEFEQPEWPEDVLALLRSLDRRPALKAMTGGVSLSLSGGRVHAQRGHWLSQDRAEAILRGDGWFVRSTGQDQEPQDQWLWAGHRGALAVGTRLGRQREAEATDRTAWPFPLRDSSLQDLVASHAAWGARVVGDREGLATVLLTAPGGREYRVRLVIDREKHVLVEMHSEWDDRVQRIVRHSDFAEAAGQWWARRVEELDEEGRTVGRYSLEVEELSGAESANALHGIVANHSDVIFLGPVDPDVETAKQAVHEKRAGFAEHFAVAIHFAASGQWDQVWEQWEQAESKVAGRPGANWLRAALLSQSRRGQEMKQLLAELAAEVARTDGPATGFLAQHSLNMAASVYQANEMLVLLDVLRPAFLTTGERGQIAYLQRRAQWLAASGQPAQSLELYREIAAARPFEIQAVMDYLNALRQGGHRRQATQNASRSMDSQKWGEYEAQRIYELWTQSLWELRELRSLFPVLESWVAREPEQETAYQRWLSMLLYLDREEEADDWVADRFQAEVTPDLDPAERARVGAAIQFALGHGWNYWAQRIEDKWHRPLAELGRRLVRQEDQASPLASRIMNDGRFANTDAGFALRRSLLEDLTPEAIASMPLDRLGRYLRWIPWGRTQVSEAAWEQVLEQVKRRWSGTENGGQRPALAGHVLHLLDSHGERTAAIEFLRLRLEGATDDVRVQVANDLLNRLIAEEWSQALEDEILALVPALQPAEAIEAHRQDLAAGGVRWVADQLERLRYEAHLGPAADREQLARQALARKRTESRRRARLELATRFATEREVRSRTRPWFELERLSLLAQIGEGPVNVDGEVRELLFSVGAEGPRIQQVLRERCAFVIAYVASRPEADSTLVDGAIELLRQRIGDDSDRADAYRIDWQHHLFRLLIALDRPDELARELRSWIVPAEVNSRWRIALGYLLAETGQLDEAVAAFEAVARQDELGAPEYRALANWYLVLGDRGRRETALAGQYQASPEYQLSNLLSQELNRISRRGDGIPPELDPETMRILQALLAKATTPSNYIWQVTQLYNTVKDFQVLESLANGVIGHTAEGIYPFLQQVGSVISNVHEEATCDSLIQRMAELAPRSKGVDRRALLLIQALVERRAAEVLNQPGPHGTRALAALRAAFQGSWLPGERRLMASFLASLGRIPQPALAAEQVRQLTALHDQEQARTFDRLQIALFLFRTHWVYGSADMALDGLAAALSEFRAASGDALRSEANSAIETLMGWYESRQRFRLAETWLRRELATEPSRSQKNWLTQRLFQIYVNCLSSRGAVALGRGNELYRGARTEMERWMFTAGADQVPGTISSYCQLHHHAQRIAGVPGAGADLERFARQTLPELLTELPGNVQSVVSTVANMLEQLSGPRVALEFLIERLEGEPNWYGRVNQGGWRHFAYNLGQWRQKAGPLGALEPRLLRIVLAELERDLLSMQQHARVIYQIHNSYFWQDKADDFATVALRVIETNPDSPARLLYAADYLWHGLGLGSRAIATLLAAEERGMLREDGRHRLVSWLHSVERYRDSLALLDKLTAERPDRLDYRSLKIRALHEVGRDEDAIAYLDETEERFKAHNSWNEHSLATLASLCLTCDFHERSITYYEEVIPLHQRTQRNRGIGNGTLSMYYGQIAQAYIAIGEADQAVDAASAAVVSWGRTNHNRQIALSALQSVIAGIEDLDAYVARRHKQIEETGLDAPVIRKAIGRVYLARREADKAIPQLLAARQLQVNDAQTHEALLAAYDALGQTREACQALLEAIQATPMNLQLYSALGTRLARLDDIPEAERAWTSLVEVQPNEAESHRLLAQHRQRQRLYAQAIEQWQQVIRVRTDEPDGWLSLSRAQALAGDKTAAIKTLQQVIGTQWDARFGDVKRQALQILAPLSKPPR